MILCAALTFLLSELFEKKEPYPQKSNPLQNKVSLQPAISASGLWLFELSSKDWVAGVSH